jgi:DNA-binding transcriptional ArsR family regulator
MTNRPSWPTTTRHLGVLTGAGLIQVERHGRPRHYQRDRKHLRDAAALWFASLDLVVGDRPDPGDPGPGPPGR